MDILKPTAVIGTNAWGSALYEKAMRGSLYDLARDYGLGKAQKISDEGSG